MAFGDSLPQINLGVQGGTQWGSNMLIEQEHFEVFPIVDRYTSVWKSDIHYTYDCYQRKLVNAYVIYREINLPKLSLKDFRKEISREFISSASVPLRNKRQITNTSVQIENKKTYVPKKTRWESYAHQPERSTRRRCAASSANSLVYADKPQTLDHLEDNIRRVIADIRPQMLEKVIENWTSRLDYIRASRGSPMPKIIFKI
ncbi:hypothetical protein TNCV_4992621 [Trichonephila clavipes]|nr:hypothetical protein TNCV_4992621 [Trichonephila clavipes]